MNFDRISNDIGIQFYTETLYWKRCQIARPLWKKCEEKMNRLCTNPDNTGVFAKKKSAAFRESGCAAESLLIEEKVAAKADEWGVFAVRKSDSASSVNFLRSWLMSLTEGLS